MAHIQVIVGSTRPGRVGRKIANWHVNDLEIPAGTTLEIVDLADAKLPFLDEAMPAMYGQYSEDHTKTWSEIIAKADGYIWVTPEYNHAPSPALLNAISYLKKEWAYKPVAFVGYGTMGGTRAIEDLVSVSSELSMVPLRERVSILEPWVSVSEDGTVSADYVKGDKNGQIAELVKWAEATKSLRD